MDIVSQTASFDGKQTTYEHYSGACRCNMRVSIYTPAQAEEKKCAGLVWLSGLTCNQDNFMHKAGAQRMAAKLGLVIIAPDTSPRGEEVPDEPESYDFGKGAGFYLDATEDPWAKHYNMESYIRDDLTKWVIENLPVDGDRLGIFGHSMGGHGAITLHLKNPGLYKTCSAFAPIVAPMRVPWGQKALTGYLGANPGVWKQYDASALVLKNPGKAEILIDQGGDDPFLNNQLRPVLFEKACTESGQAFKVRMHKGYDHSYYFIATFIEDHLEHHVRALEPGRMPGSPACTHHARHLRDSPKTAGRPRKM